MWCQHSEEVHRIFFWKRRTQWRSQPKIMGEQKILGGTQCLTLGEQDYFCLGRLFSKHKIITCAKNLRGHGPFAPTGYARPATRGGQSGNYPPKFSQTYVFVRCSNKLHHFPPPENISWLRPWSTPVKTVRGSKKVEHHCSKRNATYPRITRSLPPPLTQAVPPSVSRCRIVAVPRGERDSNSTGTGAAAPGAPPRPGAIHRWRPLADQHAFAPKTPLKKDKRLVGSFERSLVLCCQRIAQILPTAACPSTPFAMRFCAQLLLNSSNLFVSQQLFVTKTASQMSFWFLKCGNKTWSLG